jgi:hypothetical protein
LPARSRTRWPPPCDRCTTRWPSPVGLFPWDCARMVEVTTTTATRSFVAATGSSPSMSTFAAVRLPPRHCLWHHAAAEEDEANQDHENVVQKIEDGRVGTFVFLFCLCLLRDGVCIFFFPLEISAWYFVSFPLHWWHYWHCSLRYTANTGFFCGLILSSLSFAANYHTNKQWQAVPIDITSSTYNQQLIT